MTDTKILPEGIPPLSQYYFYLTAGCNLACQHCWLAPVYQPHGTTGGHLDYEIFKLAIEEGLPLGLRSAKLTGGEPLLHPDFIRIMEYLKENELAVTIETNGTLLTPAIVKYFWEKSSLSFISISLDGATSATHDPFRGVKGSFDQAVAGIKMLVEVGYRPQVIMSLHMGNVDEIEQLVIQAQSWGAGSVKFNLIQPSGRGEQMLDRGQVLDIHCLVELGNWVERDLQKRVNISLHYSWPMIFYSLDRLLKRGNDSCGILSILGVLANGSLAMCGIGMEIPELTYGMLGRDRVEEVWFNNQVLKDIRRDIPANLENPCGNCLFKWQCLGSCIAENYHQARRLTAPFWFCQQAEKASLLPSNRVITQ